jgi:myo-inositol-1(or 4)-monophosphatase
MQEVESERATDEYLSGDIAMDIVNRAIVFVAKAYCGSTRNGTSLSRLLHAAEAATIAESITDDREVIAAAALHNVLKDTDSKASQIQIEFGARVRKLVEAGSENKRPELSAAETWKTQKSEMIDYLRSAATKDERIVTLADKLSDIRACVRDYRQIGDAVWEKLDMPNREMQAWYYTALCNALRGLRDTDAWQEFDCLVKELFPEIKRKAMPQGDVETDETGDVEVLKTPKDTL